MKLCTRPIFLPWPFFYLFARSQQNLCTMNGGHFLDTNSFNHLTLIIDKSTVSKDDVVVNKTYCFDLDLSLMLWKVTSNLYPLCSMDARLNAGGFDSIRVTMSFLNCYSKTNCCISSNVMGVCCIVFDIDGMFELFMNFGNIEKCLFIYYVVSPDSSGNSGNLIHPFMRVTN